MIFRLPRVLILAALATLLSSTATRAQNPASTEREISFSSGAVTLAGTLLLPPGEGPWPAVVFLHGSGPMTRAGFRPYAEEFAKLGVASLFFDKRGTGMSGGSWIRASLDDLTADALAAVHFLKTQDGIDSTRIGLWGVSQAGWVETSAASQSPDVGFLIVISGGGASPRESELFSYENAFDDAGLTSEQKTQARGLVKAYFDYLATGEDRASLAKQLEGLKSTPDDPLSALAGRLDQILPSEDNRSNWSWVATWNPMPFMAKIHCPVLLMFGDHDTEHPTELAVRRWREGLAQAEDARATIMVFPGAGHGIRMGHHRVSSGRAPFADGYSEAMLGWLWQHVVQGEP